MIATDGAGNAVPHAVTVVVPVKHLAHAKSRLTLPADQRRALALAFALDTITSMCRSPLVSGVLVVTSDPVVASRVRRLGVRLTHDQGTGLGPALCGGIRVATAWQPESGVAVAPADLPCLRVDDVTRVVLGGSVAGGAFVPDRSGTGTTFVLYPPGRTAITRYGPGSAARHRALGLHALDDAPLGGRHDVDTLDDLRAAGELGPGPETCAVLSALDLGVGLGVP